MVLVARIDAGFRPTRWHSGRVTPIESRPRPLAAFHPDLSEAAAAGAQLSRRSQLVAPGRSLIRVLAGPRAGAVAKRAGPAL